MNRPGQRLARGLGPFSAVALVAGNIIASGIYVVPASLAEIAGPVSLFAWLLNAIAFLCLAAVFAALGGAYPITGGPQSFVRLAFGDFWSLLTSYLYWFSCVTCNSALATGLIGYLVVFFPAIDRPWASFAVAQVLLWAFTIANILGVRVGGVVQSSTTVLKIIPLLVLAVALMAHASTVNLVPFAPHGTGALLPSVALVAWLYLGAESVTVPGEEVSGAGRTIRRAAYSGFALASIVYILVACSLSLGLPGVALVGTASPLAVAASRVLGPAGGVLLTLGALVSIGGALNGWILVTGRLPFAAARDGTAPALLGRVHPRFATPAVSLTISTACSSVLAALYFHRTLLHAYNFIALLSTATALVAIGLGTLAYLRLLRRDADRFSPRQRRWGPSTAVLGLAVVILMIAGTGVRIMLLTLMATAPPAAYHLWSTRIRRRDSN
ncbi:MAG: amino acid permease [Acidobacteriota bacterium]